MNLKYLENVTANFMNYHYLLCLFIDQKLHLNIYQFQHATVKVWVPLLDFRDLYCQAAALNQFHLSLPSNIEMFRLP